MSKLWLVLRYEFLNTIRRRSFLLMAFGVPILAVLVVTIINLINQPENGSEDEEEPVVQLDPEGLVDQSGWVEEISPRLPEGALTLFVDEESANQALQQGDIVDYYIVPADYVKTGKLIYVAPDINPLEPEGQTWMVRQTLVFNLLGRDMQRVDIFWQPILVETKPLGAAAEQETISSGADPFGVAYPLMMIFYILIITSSSLLLNSVSNEKKNRVLEILMTTIQPHELLAGKIIALGITGLLQTILWTGTFYAISKVMYTQQFTGGAGFSVIDLMWGLVFFILGYAVYASLMAAMGALAANPREASQSIFIIIAPVVLPLFFFIVLIEKPFSALATGLSLFPFTAPIAMMTRMAAIDVPLWQLLVSALLLLGTAVLVVFAAGRMFKANILLSGEKFSVKRYLSVLLGGSRS